MTNLRKSCNLRPRPAAASNTSRLLDRIAGGQAGARQRRDVPPRSRGVILPGLCMDHPRWQRAQGKPGAQQAPAASHAKKRARA